MKNYLQLFLSAICALAATSSAFAQQVQPPRESQRAEVAQTVGDARIGVVYHRPNAKGREVFGKLVPYNEVWRTGANENTTFETTENIKINGQDLPAGKYGLHTIPGQNEWTIIFNKVNNEWGSFNYKQTEDQLRVKVKPQTAAQLQETMLISFDPVTATTASVVIAWDKLRVPFTVDAGNVTARVSGKLKTALAAAAPDNQQLRNTAVNFIIDNKITESYPDAVRYSDESLKVKETFGNLRARARLAAAMGNFKDAAAYGDKAVALGKTAQPAINADVFATFQKDLAGWKAKSK